MIETNPKMLMAAHATPADPLFPRMSDSAVADPTTAVRAEISTKPLDSGTVSFIMLKLYPG